MLLPLTLSATHIFKKVCSNYLNVWKLVVIGNSKQIYVSTLLISSMFSNIHDHINNLIHTFFYSPLRFDCFYQLKFECFYCFKLLRNLILISYLQKYTIGRRDILFVWKSGESKPLGYKTFIDEDRANHMVIQIWFR